MAEDIDRKSLYKKAAILGYSMSPPAIWTLLPKLRYSKNISK
jgi:hypothetical protein